MSKMAQSYCHLRIMYNLRKHTGLGGCPKLRLFGTVTLENYHVMDVVFYRLVKKGIVEISSDGWVIMTEMGIRELVMEEIEE